MTVPGGCLRNGGGGRVFHYQGGLAIINTQSHGSGVAFGSGGGAAFGSTSTHTTGTQQTALSKKAAPP